MSQVTLTGQARDAALAQAARTYPHEACGMLIGRMEVDGPRVTRVLPCPNLADPAERGHRFVIDPRAVLNVRRSLRGTVESIVGFFHSHPDEVAAPSALDLEHIRLWPETVWMIVPVVGGEPAAPRAWWLDAEPGSEVRELGVRLLAPRVARLGMAACPE